MAERQSEAKRKAAELLDSGAIFAFGLSEREHGADIYSTDMVLTPDGAGFSASGSKHYIGNGNLAAMVSVFGRRSDAAIYDSSNLDDRRPDDAEFDGYVCFAADSKHKRYKLRRNVVNSQMYVAAFDLDNYPVSPEDVLHTGKAAFNAAINTVNIGKFNLGCAAIGACEHAFFEAVTHAENRILFGAKVTEFTQVRTLLADSYARLTAMKLYTARAIDYLRSASPRDRRYLLFNSIEKLTVTRQGEQVITGLWDIISARAFENDMYFPMAMIGVGGLPRLEGTAHVNMALSLKFMASYMVNPADAGLAVLKYVPVRPVAEQLRRATRAASPLLRMAPMVGKEFVTASFKVVHTRRDPADDAFLFRQGPSSGLGKIRFHDWRPVFEHFAHVPNVALFADQVKLFQTMLITSPPTPDQQREVDFLFALAELFILVPYAQLILEQAEIARTEVALLDQIFDVLVRDFSRHALTLHSKPLATQAQQEQALRMVRRPVADDFRFDLVVSRARALAGSYEMNP